MSKNFHRYEFGSVRSMICDRVPFGKTGSVCRKSPPRRTEIPPNGFSSRSSTSRKDLSRYSKHRLSLIGASSHMRSDVCFIRSASDVLFFISHDLLLARSIGILNLKCVVVPEGKSNDAIPEAASARTTFPSDRKKKE